MMLDFSLIGDEAMSVELSRRMITMRTDKDMMTKSILMEQQLSTEW